MASEQLASGEEPGAEGLSSQESEEQEENGKEDKEKEKKKERKVNKITEQDYQNAIKKLQEAGFSIVFDLYHDIDPVKSQVFIIDTMRAEKEEER